MIVMPFGLSNASRTLQRVRNNLFLQLVDRILVAHLEDISDISALKRAKRRASRSKA